MTVGFGGSSSLSATFSQFTRSYPGRPGSGDCRRSPALRGTARTAAAAFGRLAIRSAYRAPAVNALGNRLRLGCASNERNYGRHIWDRRDSEGCIGAMASVVVPWFADHYAAGVDWRAMAWWIHDHLPYSQLQFFPKLAAFNIGWRERRRRRIDSFIAPRGCLTRPGMANQTCDHSHH
jgi:hypothetical protein